MNLTVDTSWWTRYRSRDFNPDLDPNHIFPQVVPTLFAGQFPAIPRTDADLTPQNHIQAIANTAAFHFGFIEVGGSSLYPTLALRVTDPVVLRICLASARPRPPTSRPGTTRRATRLRLLIM